MASDFDVCMLVANRLLVRMGIPVDNVDNWDLLKKVVSQSMQNHYTEIVAKTKKFSSGERVVIAAVLFTCDYQVDGLSDDFLANLSHVSGDHKNAAIAAIRADVYY